MKQHPELADAIAGFLGAEPTTIAAIRERLVADGHDVAGADEYGIDGAYRAVQLTPEFQLLDEPPIRQTIAAAVASVSPDPTAPESGESGAAITTLDDVRVVRIADALAGVPIIVEVDKTAAAIGWLIDDGLACLYSLVIGAGMVDRRSSRTDGEADDAPVTLVDADGNHLGRLDIKDVASEHGSTDALAGPQGWLEDLTGQHISLTVVDPRRDHLTVRFAPVDAPAAPTDAQQAALLAAFDEFAQEQVVEAPRNPTVRTASTDSLLIAAILQDREAFTDTGVGRITDIALAAGLEVSAHGHTIGAPGTEWGALEYRAQVNRVKWSLDLSDVQAAAAVLIFGSALAVHDQGREAFTTANDELVDAISEMARSLDDAQVADAAWELWRENGAVPDRIDDFAGHLGAVFAETKMAGVEWLRARLAFEHGRTADAEAILREAIDIEPVFDDPAPHAGLATLLAGIEADRGDAHAAQRLLAGIIGPQDDEDDEYLHNEESESDAERIGREIAPYLARPKAQVGRNDKCPCGSGRKYKQCHLGSELHPLDDRSGWLYAKATRFMYERDPGAVWEVADQIVGPDGTEEMAEEIAATHVPIDLLLHEGGVFAAWLEQRGDLLPDDERALADVWASTPRRLFEVHLSTRDRLELNVYGTDERVVIDAEVPVDPLPTSLLIAARPLPVGDSMRLFGGLCPVHKQFADLVVDSCQDRSLDGVIDALGHTFDMA